ncbi:MAG: hypothetical protein AAF513_16785 [Pseudomonadota bacterium]
MAAFVLTIFLSVLLGGLAYLLVGTRLQLSDEERQNDLFNFIAYVFGALPIAFVAVFFGIGG